MTALPGIHLRSKVLLSVSGSTNACVRPAPASAAGHRGYLHGGSSYQPSVAEVNEIIWHVHLPGSHSWPRLCNHNVTLMTSYGISSH